eukprot:TRINITY_DN1761_c0_g1_i2.p1 TRINITY_DN1761_c0_g1~~TRINITY_DN1761_c0_g1_i2.p1  ORF type:complete len:479 (-),score=79.09 TRINITY_DN1761_c0_g1_i2:31-1467(-)
MEPPPVSSVEMPRGRRLRGCDAVAMSLYSVEDRLLAALFKARRGKMRVEETTAGTLSSAAVQALDPTRPEPGVCSAPSEGTGLTAEELQLIQSTAGEDDSDSGTASCEDVGMEEDLDPKAGLIQANGSSYRALVIHNMTGGVGLGVSRAFGSARECKGRHAVLMLGAGHFAACLFGPSGCVEKHRTCKRYVVRGNHDKKSGKAGSVGAQMRREGEKKLAEDVEKVICEWAEPLQSCDVIFVSCPPARKSMLFGKVLESTDPRLRRIPFAGIGKPNMTACVTAHSLLCSALFFRSWPSGVVPDRLPSFPELAAHSTPQEFSGELHNGEETDPELAAHSIPQEFSGELQKSEETGAAAVESIVDMLAEETKATPPQPGDQFCAVTQTDPDTLEQTCRSRRRRRKTAPRKAPVCKASSWQKTIEASREDAEILFESADEAEGRDSQVQTRMIPLLALATVTAILAVGRAVFSRLPNKDLQE